MTRVLQNPGMSNVVAPGIGIRFRDGTVAMGRGAVSPTGEKIC